MAMNLVRKTLTAVAITTISYSLGLSQSVNDYRRAHERQIIEEFTQLLAIPNVASDRENIRRNADFILGMMQQRGLNPQLLEAKSKETPPAVFGQWKVQGATHANSLKQAYCEHDN